MTEARQRIVMSVPNPETVFVLGSRHWADIGYDGITGHTAGHILLKGVGTESTVTIESPKQVVVHSTEDSLTAFASKDALLGSESSTYLVGKKQVFVAAGANNPQVPGIGWYSDAKPGASVPTSKMAAQVADVTSDAKTFYTIGALVSTVIAGAGFLLGKTFDVTSAVVTPIQLGIVGANMTLSPDYDGLMHVHGQGGTWITSGEFVNVSAIQNVNVISPQFITSTAGIANSMIALGSVSMTGAFSACVTGFVRADLFSGKTVGLTSRFGDISMMAKRVSIGATVTSFPQAATDVVEARAAKGIDLAVGTVGPPKALVQLSSEGATVTGATHTIAGEKGVSISVGTFGLNAASDGISMTRSMPGVAKKLTDAANAVYSATRAAADAAISNLVNTVGGRGQSIPLGTMMVAYEAYLTQVKAAKTTLEAQLKLARTVAAAVLRVAVTNREAHLSNGLSKMSVDAMGRIVIDGGVMPIVIKTGASSIELTPAAIKLTAPSILEG